MKPFTPRRTLSNAMRIAALVLVTLPLAVTARAQGDHTGHNHPTGAGGGAQTQHAKPSWDPELIESFEKLAVLEGGRVKPLYTQAIWLLRRLNGKASVLTPPTDAHPDGERLGPVAWYLDALFFPEHANDYEVFRIEDSNVVDALGISFRDDEGFRTKKRFDRYSFNQLQPGFDKLSQLVRPAREKKKGRRSPLEVNLLALYSGLNEYANLINHLNFTRVSIPVEGALTELFGGKTRVQVSDVLFKAKDLREFSQALEKPGGMTAQEQSAGRQAYDKFSKALRQAIGRADHYPVFFPPSLSQKDAPAWMTPQDLVLKIVFGQGDHPDQNLETQARLLVSLESMAREAHDPVSFRKDAAVFIQGLTNLAVRRGEAKMASAEV